MIPKEQEIAIKELEERVDRLRNLYEQYFLGFERLEPTVPRKDVDRRFAILRKEQIRNTAMRFKLNVITQKYNTYAMHWVRICRQIEEGTYKRHVRRAKARFGDLAGGDEREMSIDIDMGDFDMDVDMDMDSVLAEANAAAERYERPPADTVPPPPSQRPPESVRAPAASDRMARPAALPPGTKPRIVVRKREEGEPVGPPSGRLPAPSSPQIMTGGPRPSGPRIAPAAPSSARMPVAPPGAPSAGRQPVSPPGAPSGPQIRPLGSGGRMPVAAPASATGPAARPDQAQQRPAIPPPSTPRVPAGSSPKLPAPPPRAPLPLPSQSTRPAKKE